MASNPIAAEGAFSHRGEEHQARFKNPENIRHLRITAIDSHGGPWATAAEFTPIRKQK